MNDEGSRTEVTKMEGSLSGRRTIAAQVADVATSINVSDSMAVSLRRAIDDLLKLANDAINSAVASVLVRAGDDGGLRFLTATSGVTDELLALRLPPGAGIAGLVFSTTQPMAVADVAQEGSFWSEADRRTGFKTVTLLATPLRAENELVGILEFVNRPGEPPYSPFTPAEMDRAARYAEPIARLVETYELAQMVESLFNFVAQSSLTTNSPAQREEMQRAWLETLTVSPAHRDFLSLWFSLREVMNAGDAERKLCRELLESLGNFSKSRGAGSGMFGY
jgi:signal transduction protein with GAF and PtsI domain